MKRSASAALFERARKVIPGGVNSPVRAFKAVGGEPVFLARGKGARVWDVDGNEYLDHCGSWGPLILGHANEPVLAAAIGAAKDGSSFGAPTEREVLLAETIAKAIPSIERVRLTSSGTEATMSAIRVARAFTGRDAILKFEGCYHGHSDSLLAAGAGSGLATLGIPSSPGVTEGAARDTLTSPFNDLGAARAVFAEWGRDIAAVIVEPVAANMGVVPPEPGFLEGLRELCDRHGTLLLFDEVITGFRMAFGGAQSVFDICPDLSTFGKVMGGGFPCAAFGGRADLMSQLAPTGPIYQAGTLSGNPVAVAAGSATLALAAMLDPYRQLEQTATTLADGLRERFERSGIPVTINRSSSLFSVFFTEGPVRNFQDAKRADHERFARFFHHMLSSGVYLPPSGYELWTLSAVLTDEHIETILTAATAFTG